MVGGHIRRARMRGGVTNGWRVGALVVSRIVAASGYLAASIWSGWEEVVRAALQVGVGVMADALSFDGRRHQRPSLDD